MIYFYYLLLWQSCMHVYHTHIYIYIYVIWYTDVYTAVDGCEILSQFIGGAGFLPSTVCNHNIYKSPTSFIWYTFYIILYVIMVFYWVYWCTIQPLVVWNIVFRGVEATNQIYVESICGKPTKISVLCLNHSQIGGLLVFKPQLGNLK